MLYLIESNEFYKVGYSKNISAMHKRVSSYNTHNPSFKLISVSVGTPAIEKTIHSLLSSLKHRGEWFHKDDYVLEVWNNYYKPLEVGVEHFTTEVIEASITYNLVYKKYKAMVDGLDVEWTELELKSKYYKMIDNYYKFKGNIPASELICNQFNFIDNAELKSDIMNEFRPNIRYSRGDIKKKLNELYRKYEVDKKGLYSDLELFGAEFIEKKVNGNRQLEIVSWN